MCWGTPRDLGAESSPVQSRYKIPVHPGLQKNFDGSPHGSSRRRCTFCRANASQAPRGKTIMASKETSLMSTTKSRSMHQGCRLQSPLVKYQILRSECSLKSDTLARTTSSSVARTTKRVHNALRWQVSIRYVARQYLLLRHTQPAMLERLTPVYIEGDGNCMRRAVSQAVLGMLTSICSCTSWPVWKWGTMGPLTIKPADRCHKLMKLDTLVPPPYQEVWRKISSVGQGCSFVALLALSAVLKCRISSFFPQGVRSLPSIWHIFLTLIFTLTEQGCNNIRNVLQYIISLSLALCGQTRGSMRLACERSPFSSQRPQVKCRICLAANVTANVANAKSH